MSARKKADPIQYNPNENHPKPRNQEAIKKIFKEDIKLITKIPKPKAKIIGKKENGVIASVVIAPTKKLKV